MTHFGLSHEAVLISLALLFEHVPWLPYIVEQMPGIGRMLDYMRSLGINRAKVRFENGSKTKDLFYYLVCPVVYPGQRRFLTHIQSNEDGAEKASPSPAQVISDGVLATIAASDTTSNTLANTFWNILRYPQYYKRLQAEVDKYYPAGENAFDTKHHNKMVFLDAVMFVLSPKFPALSLTIIQQRDTADVSCPS